MLTKEENQLLIQVSAGTPAGELLRRYWHPIAATSQLASHGTRAIAVLGESLVLYRGRLGLVGDRCPHRQAGMLYGAPEDEGLRCAYHGWLFGASGRCLEQPFEQAADPSSIFRDRVTIKAYPVEELAGMIFAYLGPEPVPTAAALGSVHNGQPAARDRHGSCPLQLAPDHRERAGPGSPGVVAPAFSITT